MEVKTRKQALEFLRSFVGKARSEMPWLKGRPHLYDCAAGYTYSVLGKKTKIVWVSELVKRMKENKTWTKTGTPKPGDAVIYDWNGDGGCDHVAMFHSVNKAGQFVCFGADQGKQQLVTKLVTGKGVILGWGTPFNFTDPVKAERIVKDTPTEPETDVAEMPLKPEHYEPAETPSATAGSPEMSKEAILAFQVKKGLPQTGILDEATKARLTK